MSFIFFYTIPEYFTQSTVLFVLGWNVKMVAVCFRKKFIIIKNIMKSFNAYLFGCLLKITKVNVFRDF